MISCKVWNYCGTW